MGKEYKPRLQLICDLEAAGHEITSLRSQAGKYERIEEELTHSGHFYRTLFENSGTATIVIEQDTTITMMNNDFANFTGYSREEILGHTWTMYVAEDDVDRLILYHKTRRENPTAAPRNYEFKIRNNNGTISLSILDDGIGIKDTTKVSGIGLRIMHYRARMIGASLRIESEPSGGTLVTCTFNLNKD